jgi:hypothetical protein
LSKLLDTESFKRGQFSDNRELLFGFIASFEQKLNQPQQLGTAAPMFAQHFPFQTVTLIEAHNVPTP